MIRIPEAELLALLGENGEHWLQGDWEDEQGMCLHGAIRRCQPQPGDAFIIEQVADVLGWGTRWNDDPLTTWEMVRYQVAHVEVTDLDLLDTFGPQWESIVALARRAATLTGDEASRLAAVLGVAAWDAARVAAQTAAWDAARVAARAIAQAAAVDCTRDAARVAARAIAQAAAVDCTRVAAGIGCSYAVGDAARALAVRDLIGHHGFTQDHYDTLTASWAKVIGPVHPDDVRGGA